MRAATGPQRGSLRLVLQSIKTKTREFVESAKKAVIRRPNRLSAAPLLTYADYPSFVLEEEAPIPIRLTPGPTGVYRDLIFSPSEAVRHYWVDVNGHQHWDTSFFCARKPPSGDVPPGRRNWVYVASGQVRDLRIIAPGFFSFKILTTSARHGVRELTFASNGCSTAPATRHWLRYRC